MNQSKIKNKVEHRINQLIREFQKYPEKFLTEEDVRSYLYHILLRDFTRKIIKYTKRLMIISWKTLLRKVI